MKSITFSQFSHDILALPGLEAKEKSVLGFAPYLAYFLYWLSFQWTRNLSSWDLGLHPKYRPGIYTGLFILLLTLILLPQLQGSKSDEKSPVALVTTVPLVPIEPTLIPDTLFIPSLLNQQHNHDE